MTTSFEIARLEEERAKCRARLSAQSTDKCRHRTYFELASLEARLGRAEDALASLRDAIACGLDLVYAEELRTSAHFESLRPMPAFASVLAVLEGGQQHHSGHITILYASGEKERCRDDSLVCGFCNEPLRDPVVHNPCGSPFCSSCVTSSTPCPQCQGSMHQETVAKVTLRMILNKLDTLKVHCPRCFKILGRAALDEHLQQCPILCASGCKQRVAPTALEAHARVCVAVEVACSASSVGCPWFEPRKDLYNHTRSCLFVKQLPVLKRVMALEESNSALERRAGALEEANRALKARVAMLEGTKCDENSQIVY